MDDDYIIVHLLKDILKNNGFSVSISLNGIDAIKMIKEMSFDFVLSDIQMPKINGIEVLKKMKKFNPSLNIIMMTGCATKEIQNEALREGASCVLSKPIDINDLLDILKN
ncbi:response regulator [Thermoproteota archaeon]